MTVSTPALVPSYDLLPKYVSDEVIKDPIGFLAKVVGLEAYLPELRKRGDAQYLLTTLISYRAASQKTRMDLIRHVSVNIQNPLDRKIHTMALYTAVNPYWFSWSLTDKELRNLYDSNKEFTSIMQKLGFGVGSANVMAMVDFLSEVNSAGLKQGLKKSVYASTNGPLGEKVASKFTKNSSKAISTGKMSSVVTILAMLLYASSEANESMAKEELYERGLIRKSDL